MPPVVLFMSGAPVALFVPGVPVALFAAGAPVFAAGAPVALFVAGAAVVLFVAAAPVAAPAPVVVCLSDSSGVSRCDSDGVTITLPDDVEQPGVPAPSGQPQ